jgi:hypothetical protein
VEKTGGGGGGLNLNQLALNTHAIFDYNLFIACAFFGKK